MGRGGEVGRLPRTGGYDLAHPMVMTLWLIVVRLPGNCMSQVVVIC